MKTLKLAIYVSLDGVVEEPRWTGPFWNQELSDLQEAYLFSSDALVLGRVTYEGFAASWPALEEQTGEFGRKMNSLPKYVASRTLSEAEWNATVLGPDLEAEIRRLEEGDGGDLLIYGSGTLVDELLRLRLLDEVRLIVSPVIVGAGKRLFETAPETTFQLIESVTTATGVRVETYRVVA